jgi:glutamine synthetase
LKVEIAPATIALYESLGVMNKTEIEARHEIEIEEYTLRVQIEARVLGDIARNHVIPTALKYQNTLIENVKGLKDIYGAGFKKHAAEQLTLIEDISARVAAINSGVTDLINQRKSANTIEDVQVKAETYCNKVKPYFDTIRYHCDKLELLIDDEIWPLTKYRELLFTK